MEARCFHTDSEWDGCKSMVQAQNIGIRGQTCTKLRGNHTGYCNIWMRGSTQKSTYLRVSG